MLASDVSGRSTYSGVAILLHWLIALLLIGNFAGGLIMDSLLESADPNDRALGFEVVQLHKAIGLTVLWLSLIRLVWRLTHRFPPLPAHMRPWERWLARGNHLAFYLLMIGVPLIGWAMVSASPRNFPTSYFGLFDWPQLPIADSETMTESLSGLHELLAFVTVALVLLHVVGALKHHFLDRDDVLARMLPFVRPKRL